VRATAAIPALALALTFACGAGAGAQQTVATSTPGTGSVADVVARVLPSVVNVKTVGFNGDQGEASGVVIDASGVILTNFHVVRGARRLTVSFSDKRFPKPVPATSRSSASPSRA
jgi:S1-C subfamily serine protease